MRKSVQDNGKIIRSLIASVGRLTHEVYDEIIHDALLAEGQIWQRYIPAKGENLFFYNKQVLQSISKVRNAAALPGSDRRMPHTELPYTLTFRFAQINEKSKAPEGGDVWILWDEFSFDVQARLAIYLTEILK